MNTNSDRCLAGADALEAANLQRHQRLRRRQVRWKLISDLTFGGVVCLLQAVILLFTGGLAKPLVAGEAMALCLLVVLLLILTPRGVGDWRRKVADYRQRPNSGPPL
ncbi:MAG: hypothetical protein DLM67_19860 [Candidatus Nephthysia bennettiae]|nr:MAG: hypothetical protein DLM67_19860 [Candidatus Dormibacteraeota bacterium]